MRSSSQLLNDESFRLLASLLNREWRCTSGEFMNSPDFAWERVLLSTNSSSIELALDLHPLNIDGLDEEYPFLSVARHDVSGSGSGANSYFHGKGETVREVLVLREVLEKVSPSDEAFRNVADIGVFVRLDSLWISAVRATHFVEAFDISYAENISDIGLPDTIDEWDDSLVDQFTLAREWIDVSPFLLL